MSSEILESTIIEPATASRRNVGHRFVRNPMGMVALVVLVVIIVCGLLAPWIMPFDPNAGQLSHTNAPPGGVYLLGGDPSGRDVLSRLIAAINISMIAAFLSTFVAAIVGVPCGLIAGYYQGRTDSVMTWIFNMLQAFPTIVFLIALYAVVGSDLTIMMIAIGIFQSVSFYRLVRGQVVAVKNELFIDAARVSGLSDLRIIARHVFFVVRAPIVITASFVAGVGITLQAALAFLGIADANVPTWGAMIQDAFTNLYTSPAQIVWPALMLGITIAAFVLIGTALRDALEGGGSATSSARSRRRAAATAVTAPAEPTPAAAGDALLSVQGLTISYPVGRDERRVVVHDVDLALQPGETLGLVGESGSGKSQTAFAILDLLPAEAQIDRGAVRFRDVDLSTLPRAEARRLRGRRLGYVPQEPMSNLDPSFTVGSQLVYGIRALTSLTRRQAKDQALELLGDVGIVDPPAVFRSYPHQISGGMAQRVLIAGAIAGEPDILIADEPTTALDVTVQAEILDLLRRLQQEHGMAMLLVTHNFGVVADICDRVAVMQHGRIVETGDVRTVLSNPTHPYTRQLLDAILDDDTPLRREVDFAAAAAAAKGTTR